MKNLLLILFLTCFTLPLFAGKVTGHTTDMFNQPLSFCSITVKGTVKGTSANNIGFYSISLPEGNYTLLAQHVGYKTTEKQITVGKEDIVVNFQLPEQQYELGNVIVKQGEDPAYEIIRNAIKKRSYYETENKKFEAEVYIKGQFKLRDFPNKFLGQKVDFEDGDTSKRKMIFLSESVAKYYVDEPQRKVEVISTKVSGSSSGFGFGSPMIFSFYENNIELGNLNPRGFISPIANRALSYYNYKLEGTFFENKQMVNRIKVTPKRKYEPLFNGYINIIENEWRIQSVQLVLYKENQMQLVDTLKIEQLYIPYKGTWIIKQQTLYPAIKFLGFDATGNFVQVYDKFNLDPVFPKKFFDATVLKYEDSANKKTTAYWDSIRPLPLLQEEITDYKKKDSLEQARKDPKYLDSLDRKRNKINILTLLTTGQVFSKEKRKTTLSTNGLIDALNFNTVEGAVVEFSLTYTKRFSDVNRNRISVTPNFRYGFSNKHFNAHLSVNYSFGKKYFSNLSLSGGKRVFQFDNADPISPKYNSISTLLYEQNYMKIYEAYFGRIGYNQDLGEGFAVNGSFQYQDRMNLENTTTTKWREIKDRSYTPNFTLTPNQAAIATVGVTWQPGTKYIEYPNRKVKIGSDYPTFNASFTKGIKSLFGSDVDYSKWSLGVSDDINMKLFGSLSYRATIGGFLDSKSVFLPDYNHFTGNQLTVAAPFLNAFQLMPYYAYSNTEKFYTTAHVEYHLNGFLTNKIPLFRKLNWFLVAGSNALFLKSGKNYTEGFIGLENIFKVIRVDFVKSWANDNISSTGVRIALPIRQ